MVLLNVPSLGRRRQRGRVECLAHRLSACVKSVLPFDSGDRLAGNDLGYGQHTDQGHTIFLLAMTELQDPRTTESGCVYNAVDSDVSPTYRNRTYVDVVVQHQWAGIKSYPPPTPSVRA